MNTQDRITDLLSKGVSAVTFTLGEGGAAMVAATQILQQPEWHSKMTIEAVGASHSDALNLLADKIEHFAKIAPVSKILRANSN